MCPDCYNAHQMLQASFGDHNVTPVKEFKTENYEALLKRLPFCSKQFHEKHITEFFCFSCNDCVCLRCTATEHKSHEVEVLDKAAHDEKPNIKAGAEMIKEKINELNEVIRQFGETSTELKHNFEMVKQEVSETAKRMIEKIQESERHYLEFLEATLEKREKKITSAEKKTKSVIKQMEQAVEFAENLTDRSSSSHIMSNKDTLKQRNEELRGVAVPKHDETTFIKFSAASIEALELGVIETTEKKAEDKELAPVAAQEGQWSCRLM